MITMKHKIYNQKPIFIPYNDNDMEIVINGPDYGQLWKIDDQADVDWLRDETKKLVLENSVH